MRERFARAAVELASSPRQAEWAAGIAADAEALELVESLPAEAHQPSLLFALARRLGAPAAGYPVWRGWLLAHRAALAAEAPGRRVQTNEVGRCIPLLLGLDRIAGPIALLELGAAAGLCLGVDRYSYRFDGGPRLGAGEPELAAASTGPGGPPERLPEIVWRRGVDLAPLDLRDPADRGWLEDLLPPDRPDRLARLRAACATLAADPPELVAGDALDALPGLLAAMPAGASRVVASLGTLVYLPAARRRALREAVADSGARLLSFEPLGVVPEAAAALPALDPADPLRHLLALDEEPLALLSAHGERLRRL